MSINATTEGDILDIFVESQGHLNYGPDLADPKVSVNNGPHWHKVGCVLMFPEILPGFENLSIYLQYLELANVDQLSSFFW